MTGRRLTDPGYTADDAHDHPGYADPVEQQAAALGAALTRFGDQVLVEVMREEVAAEIDAIRRAGLGDLTGRAEQAVRMDRRDASPTQIQAAHEVMYAATMQLAPHTELLTLEPAAACVALVIWCHAAARLYGQITGADPAAAARAAAGREHHVDVDVLTSTVRWMEDNTAPARIVAHLGDSIRPARLRDRLVVGYWGICQAVEDTVVVAGDATPLFGGLDRLPAPEGETWAGLRDRDPGEYAEEVRYAAHVETRHRVAALVDTALNRTAR